MSPVGLTLLTRSRFEGRLRACNWVTIATTARCCISSCGNRVSDSHFTKRRCFAGSRSFRQLLVIGAFILGMLTGCGDRSGPFPEFSRPEIEFSTIGDTIVVLYYAPLDCFTCFGAMGHWIALADNDVVRVRLSLDEQPAAVVFDALSRMRLPFEIGVSPRLDGHRIRPGQTVKEVVFVNGTAVDSAVTSVGNSKSRLLEYWDDLE